MAGDIEFAPRRVVNQLLTLLVDPDDQSLSREQQNYLKFVRKEGGGGGVGARHWGCG